MEKKENKEKSSLMMNFGRTVFVYDKDIDLVKNSNIPHINVEDWKNWKGHSVLDNPNEIGQIHQVENEVVFHLCYSSSDKMLTKADLKAIIKGIEYVEDFVKKKNGGK